VHESITRVIGTGTLDGGAEQTAVIRTHYQMLPGNAAQPGWLHVQIWYTTTPENPGTPDIDFRTPYTTNQTDATPFFNCVGDTKPGGPAGDAFEAAGVSYCTS
jgi:hypothetical protein